MEYIPHKPSISGLRCCQCGAMISMTKKELNTMRRFNDISSAVFEDASSFLGVLDDTTACCSHPDWQFKE